MIEGAETFLYYTDINYQSISSVLEQPDQGNIFLNTAFLALPISQYRDEVLKTAMQSI